jgi:two-component system, LytTR family, response regulator
MIRCVIIDDEQPAIDVLEKYIAQVPYLQLTGATTNPLAGIELIRKQKAELVFLDIQMDELSGLEVMKLIPPETKVVLCTAYSEYAVASYDLDVIDYLMKPIAFSRFMRAVQRVADKLPQQQLQEPGAADDYIMIRAEHKGKMIKIDLDDIDFIEGRSNYVAFHRGKEVTMAYLTLKELEERLPESRFIRVHKSYIVALSQIAYIENNEFVLKRNKTLVPISAAYKDAFWGRIKNKLMS